MCLAGPTIVIDRAHQERIVNFLFYLKKKGYRKSTLEGYSDVFKHLARSVDIDDVEAIKAFIAILRENCPFRLSADF